MVAHDRNEERHRNTLDWGPEALLDTIELFRGMGKYVIGAGKDAEEARRPAIVERNGVKIAFLSYCSVLRDGQAAGMGKVGIAPMRAHTHYLPEWVSDQHSHRFRVKGDEVVVDTSV